MKKAALIFVTLICILVLIACGNKANPKCKHKNTENIIGIKATCIASGLTDGVKCLDCKEMITPQAEISAIGHKESEWIVDVEATQSTHGKKHTVCTVCSQKVSEEIIRASGSIGLEYELNTDKKTYTLTGLGSCKDFDIIIPLTHNSLPITAIGEKAFSQKTEITSIDISSNVVNIGDYAFELCSSLKSISIPNSVTNIGDYAFNFCSSLESILIPNSVASIGNGAFSGCSSLTSIALPNGLTCIEVNTFAGCSNLSSISIPNSITKIGGGAFSGCSSLASIAIPNSVTTIGNYAFNGCSSLTSITIPDSVASFGVADNYYSDYSWFPGCTSLKKVVLGKGIKEIPYRAFRKCTSLETIVITESVTRVGINAFEGCSNLSAVYYTGSSEKWRLISVGGNNELLTGANIIYNYTP